MPAPIRVRIAPSPTGPLHIGTARTALFNYLFARHTGGTFVLRLEDTDVARSTEAYEKDILDGLHWLGHRVGRGPGRGRREEAGPYAPYRQMQRLPDYAAAAQRLLAADAAYPCYCTPGGARCRPQGPGGREAAAALRRPLRGADGRGARRARGRGPPAGASGSASGEGVIGWDDMVRDRVEIDTANLGGDFVIVRGRRHAALPLHGRGRRRRDGDQPRDPRRGPRRATRPSTSCCSRRWATRMPVFAPPAAHPQRRRHQDEQAQEPDRRRRLHRAGLHQAKRSSTTSRSSAGRPGTEEDVLSLDEIEQRFEHRQGPEGRRAVRPRAARVGQRPVDPAPRRRRPRRAAAAVPRGGASTATIDRMPDRRTRCARCCRSSASGCRPSAAIVDLVGLPVARRARRRPGDPRAQALGRGDDAATASPPPASAWPRHDAVTWEAEELEPPLRDARRGPRLEGRRPVHGDPRRDDRADRDAAAVRHARRPRAGADARAGSMRRSRRLRRLARRDMNGR